MSSFELWKGSAVERALVALLTKLTTLWSVEIIIMSTKRQELDGLGKNYLFFSNNDFWCSKAFSKITRFIYFFESHSEENNFFVNGLSQAQNTDN